METIEREEKEVKSRAESITGTHQEKGYFTIEYRRRTADHHSCIVDSNAEVHSRFIIQWSLGTQIGR